MQYDVKYNVRMYHGKMNDESRDRAVSDFNSGDANVFLGEMLKYKTILWLNSRTVLNLQFH